MAGLVYEPFGCVVHIYPLLPELERTVHPRDERGGDHRDDEEGGDYESVRPLDLVGDESVDEDGRDQAEQERR